MIITAATGMGGLYQEYLYLPGTALRMGERAFGDKETVEEQKKKCFLVL